MSKTFKTYEELLSFLQNEKNLTIKDTDAAKRILLKTGYFSLISGYKDTFKNPTTGKYMNGITFDDIYRLYKFDNDMRSIFLKYIIIAEHSIKSSLAYHFSATYGADQKEYLSLSHYMNTGSTQKEVQKLVNIFQYHLKRNSEYTYINHYKSKYKNVPLWVMIKVLTLGQVSHMFDCLKASVPIKVCNDFNQIGLKDMHSFLSIMTKHRNVCAHGERFFNYKTKDSITDTAIHKKLNIAQVSGRYQMGKNDLFSEIIILKYLLDEDDFRDFYYELKACHKKRSPGENVLVLMGFPKNWMSILRMKC